MMRRRGVLPVVALVLLLSQPGMAAEFSYRCEQNGSEEVCGIELSGKIKPGDFVKLESLLFQNDENFCENGSGERYYFSDAERKIDLRKMKKIKDACGEDGGKLIVRDEMIKRAVSSSGPGELALFLNSPGGTLSEGLLMAHSVYQMGIKTIVWDGETCESSCALIFMAGSYRWKAYHHHCRYLHPRAKLQFHAPYSEINAIANVATVYSNAISDVAMLGSILGAKSRDRASFDGGVPWMRAELFLELLAKGPGEFVEIARVDDLARYNIMLTSYQKPNALKPADVDGLCWSFREWRVGNSAISTDDEGSDNSARKAVTWKSLERKQVEDGVSEVVVQGNGGSCHIKFADSATAKETDFRDWIDIAINDRNQEADDARRWVGVPTWTILDPSTEIVSLAPKPDEAAEYGQSCAFDLP